ncbi:trifunctional transcriptional regulator/proline dehydrogenase/L-glutamate gamma-semialdehyde dehydrogenase [Affinibrenneria salicis]|uniref:Bifunctional protein PutA n=1 Tax=Affinibrenneria salicis TaxID=2590031 RepID=A0A5J5G0J7_9GAMM|nr:trifunctional transcriptional regulator/proline dehydrogenase/L-glutamate gamma-semialdehyde dehydrogenase [Affinibrenneria salicis]KAA9000080.1 trifunctional transcriptional regulator/proline dehydrogenase/L-glutamate gamma-semialdehyde dehydrogenase [Affinibrenneria salicis]
MTAATESNPLVNQDKPAYSPFGALAAQVREQDDKRKAITAAWELPEQDIVSRLFNKAQIPDDQDILIHKLAHSLASSLRKKKISKDRASMIQNLLQEYSLSSKEGIALMCLAEALLRIPDDYTRDLLIRDKIMGRDWKSHLGKNRSLFINAATWGLLVTGSVVRYNDKNTFPNSLKKVITRGSSLLIRKAMDVAMHIMSGHFVTGETIGQALQSASTVEQQGFTYTYDMLGEAALTRSDAKNYLQRCQDALNKIGEYSKGKGIYAGSEFSLKLSALHPRYSRHQYDRLINEIYPTLKSLVLLAKSHDIAITIDAEEAERLDISLDLLTRLCNEPELHAWDGIGFVVQAYQKRCAYVIDFLKTLAQTSRRRLRVRLVKGAYWDSEIKRSQVAGHTAYPVFTRKIYSDISYLACARSLLSAPELIYPQFATHNAHTLAAIYYLAGNNYQPRQYEFQCLHGMGVPLYQEVVGADKLNRPCRIYAPVGSHETLLPYLVRRLLENGSNSSFVNQIADPSIAIDELIASPLAEAASLADQEHALGLPHPKIPLPKDIYGAGRKNSSGLNLYSEAGLQSLAARLTRHAQQPINAVPVTAEKAPLSAAIPIVNPAEPLDVIGSVCEATDADIAAALTAAQRTGVDWSALAPGQRAAVLERAADLMEDRMCELMDVLVREAGKTFSNAIAEVREAVDFLNYYARQVKNTFANQTHTPLGTVVCISPWNFPLAIFTGQIAAALAAGNGVIAKPAEQTPLIAFLAVNILHEAGIPIAALQFLPGRGETVGERLIVDERVKGIMFTGSTDVATLINKKIAGRLDAAGRPIPLIAETGGINAMIVDSSALPEQVITDCMISAFDSAGQRCSALRLLCVQDDVADTILTALRGTMVEYRMGNPAQLSTDIGPVIDAQAMSNIDAHIREMASKGFTIYQASYNSAHNAADKKNGYFITPTLVEIKDIEDLRKEVFGPVLHVLRYDSRQLPALVEKINRLGYGLTFGIHSRIDRTLCAVTEQIRVGNIYINRNVVGAVVGVQPFGGEGLSGTGPKAGGPLYLYRLLTACPADAQRQGLRDTAVCAPESLTTTGGHFDAWSALSGWAAEHDGDIHRLCKQFKENSASFTTSFLPGPTGEDNSYRLLPRERVLGLAESERDLLIQLAAIAAIGSRALWPDGAHYRAAYDRLPGAVRTIVRLVPESTLFSQPFDAVIHHGNAQSLQTLCAKVAERDGPIVSVQGLTPGDSAIRLERLLIERAFCVNSAAAGGNTRLMTL